MNNQNVLKSFEKCLINCNLEDMTEDLKVALSNSINLSNFYTNSPSEFIQFCETLKEYLMEDLKLEKDENTEVKKEMLNLIEKNTKHILKKCNQAILNELISQQNAIKEKIKEVQRILEKINVIYGKR